VALGGSKAEDPACDCIPDSGPGPVIPGTFTVAYDKDQCSADYPDQCAHYNVHVVLNKFGETHLFSFATSLGDEDLCTVAEDTEVLKELFKRTPCTLDVGGVFGLEGIPIIKRLTVTQMDFCGTPDEMITGSIQIRVVPVPPECLE
jgi:hypothetical protein